MLYIDLSLFPRRLSVWWTELSSRPDFPVTRGSLPELHVRQYSGAVCAAHVPAHGPALSAPHHPAGRLLPHGVPL